jgi:hypothetical protein
MKWWSKFQFVSFGMILSSLKYTLVSSRCTRILAPRDDDTGNENKTQAASRV